MPALANTKVAVTGVTGFIGAALASRLHAEGATVRGLGRRLERADGLIPDDIERVGFELADARTFPAAVAGQDLFFHVAAFTSDDDGDKAHALNVDAPAALIRAAGAAGVRRFVLVSSVAAYGEPDVDRVTEDQRLDTTQAENYGRTKAIGEGAAWAAAEEAGIELVIVRPAMVFGPRSWTWSVTMLKMVKGGTPTLFGKADGHAFPVYIDNLVDAFVLCATVPEAAGEAFHFADTTVTWEQWFGHYSRMSGRRLRRIPLFVAKALAVAAETLPLGLPLTRARLRMYCSHIVYETAKAERILGWKPQVDIEEGMRRTEAWFRETGRL